LIFSKNKENKTYTLNNCYWPISTGFEYFKLKNKYRDQLKNQWFVGRLYTRKLLPWVFADILSGNKKKMGLQSKQTNEFKV